MSLASSRMRMRREAFAHAHGSLNLIPLVDILTAIVFFSLLSFVTLRGALASFDLVAPPAAATPDAIGSKAVSGAQQIVVRVDRDRFVVRHSGGETTIARAEDRGLNELHRALAEVADGSRGRSQITVVPSDDVLYDDVVRVLDEIQRVRPGAVALGTRARQ